MTADRRRGMRTRRVLWKGLVLMSAMAIATASRARAGEAAPLPDMTVPASCGVQLKGHNHSPEDLDRIRALGFRWVRRGFIWKSMEPARGQYDFSAYEALMANLRQRRLRLLGCIAFGNRLYAPDAAGVRTPESREGYARFAAALARRYKDHGVVWEIWNEPNTRTFWGWHGEHNSRQYAEEYTALVKAAVAAMREADPGCFVVAGSVSCLWKPSYEWTAHCLKAGILTSGINGWSVHPYGFKRPEDYIGPYGRVREMLTRHGAPKDFPLLNSERGFPLKKAEGWAGGEGSKRQVLHWQACHFVRQYLVDLLCGVRVTIWYEWTGEAFGLADGGRNRPAADACKAMTDHLTGYRLARRLPTRSALDYVLLFEKDSGERKLVAWTAPPSRQSPDRTKDHDLDVKVSASGALATRDLYGKEGTVEVTDGRITLAFTGAPQYVIVRGGTTKKGG